MLSEDNILEWTKTGHDGPRIKNHTATVIGNRLYVFGGYDGKSNHNKLHVFDCQDNAWTTLTPAGESPSGRNGHTATFAHGSIFILGGWLGVGPYAASDLWGLDIEANRWWRPSVENDEMELTESSGPDFVPGINGLVVFRGGDGRRYMNDLKILYFNSNVLNSTNRIIGKWQTPSVSGSPPDARANHSSAVLDNKVYIFGGWDGQQRLNDLHIYDPIEQTWTQPIVYGVPPTPRAGMTLTFVRGKLFLFGGSGPNAACFSDLQIYDPVSSTWLVVHDKISADDDEGDNAFENPNIDSYSRDITVFGEGPTKRAGHTASLVNRRLLIYGGSQSDSYLGNIFMLDTDRVPKIKLPPPMTFSCLSEFVDNEKFSDVTFIVEGKKVFGHKIILSLASKHFRCMFGVDSTVGFRESREAEIALPDMSYEIFIQVIKFMYTGKLPQLDDNTVPLNEASFLEKMNKLLDFLDVSNQFFIDNLKQLCERQLSKYIRNETIEELSRLSELYQANQLHALCLHYHRNINDAGYFDDSKWTPRTTFSTG